MNELMQLIKENPGIKISFERLDLTDDKEFFCKIKVSDYSKWVYRNIVVCDVDRIQRTDMDGLITHLIRVCIEEIHNMPDVRKYEETYYTSEGPVVFKSRTGDGGDHT